VAVGGEIWVVSGDYKTTDDGLSTPFEPVRCHGFITECTFGLPVFRWTPEAQLRAEITAWWQRCAAEGKTAILGAYALGKAQRLMVGLDPSLGPILTHGAVEATNAVLRAQGVPLPPTIPVTAETDRKATPGALVIAPPSALGSAWARKFGPREEAFASGWMALRGVRRRRALGTGFVVSDHADWAGLLEAVTATGAETVLATHGYTATFSRYLSSLGYNAGVLETEFSGEDAEPAHDTETVS
jgi:putative mRNA 3-end processing factor